MGAAEIINALTLAALATTGISVFLACAKAYGIFRVHRRLQARF